jgi:hypothetical protein
MEDPIDKVVKPRLEAAGADLARVGFLGGVEERTAYGAEKYHLQLPRDLDLVARAVREYQPALLVIDPLFAVMGLDRRGRFIKANDDQSVRQLTGALKQLAEETAMTVLLIRHLTKNRRSSAVLRGSGSVAIAGQARAVLLAAKDPLDPKGSVVAMAKSNLGEMPRSLRFGPALGQSSVGPYSRVEWRGECELTADDLLFPPEPVGTGMDEPAEEAYEKACAFLRQLLADGPKTWAEVEAAAVGQGLTSGTLRVARKTLSLVRSGRGPGTRWRLPAAEA